MVLNAKRVITYTKRYLVRLVVNFSTKAYEHPIFAGVFLFSLLLYKYLPYLFSFLVFLSPIVICTGLLLGILLCYGHPNIHGIEDDHDTAAADELLSPRDVYHDPNEEDEMQDPIKVNTRLQENLAEAQGSYGIIDDEDTSESESDHSESSSPDASMTDIIPMLYELHPLLDSEEPQPLIISTNDAHSASGSSIEEIESEEEAENTEEGVDEESEEKNEDGAELAVKWTEDDEKNVIVLGTSDLERNQRLETLIAKRRARKSMFELERNLIDLDGGETVASASGLSNFLAQIHPISVARHNPFDLPFDNEASSGFHAIPGSAPSVLLPRQNPFDSPPGSVVEGGDFSGFSGNNQGFAGFHPREAFFRRHESFAHVAPLASDVRFRPYFVSERANAEETSYAHLQRQLSDKSESKESSSQESESSSSEDDQAEKKLTLKEAEFGVILDSKTSEVEKSSSDEENSVDSETLKPSTNETIGDEIQHLGSSSSPIPHVPKSSDHSLEPVEDSVKSVSVQPVNESDAEPVYDLSPSAVGKFRAQMASFENNGTTSNLSSAERDKNESKSTDVGDIRDHDAIHVEHTEEKDEQEYVGKTMESDGTEGIESEQFSVKGKATADDEHTLSERKDISSSRGNINTSESQKEEIPAALHENSEKGGNHVDRVELQQNDRKFEIFSRVRSRRYKSSTSSSSSSSSSSSDSD